MTPSKRSHGNPTWIARRATPTSWIAIAAAATVVGQGAQAQTRIPPTGPDFAVVAVQSDQYEIDAAEDALAQTQNPQVRAFAQQMIVDHTQSRDAMREAATVSGLPPPPAAMSSDQAALLASLQSLRGPDFDRTYAKQQVLAHRESLAVEQSFALAGADPNLRRIAHSSAPMIQRHLEMAERMRVALGGF